MVQRAIDCGFAVHRALGPGFRERIHQRAYALELADRQLRFDCEKPILVRYKQWNIPGQTVDVIVEGIVLVEINRSLACTTSIVCKCFPT